MRYGPLLFAALLCSGCRGDGISRGPTNGFVPTTPVPPLQTPPGSVPVVTISGTAAGWLWVMVMDGSGTCIDGAVIEIVSGQGKGFKGTPSASCDVWDLDGGYIIYGLVPGGSLTIRASAPGYMDSEKTFLAAGAESQQASIITLARLNGQPYSTRGPDARLLALGQRSRLDRLPPHGMMRPRGPAAPLPPSSPPDRSHRPS